MVFNIHYNADSGEVASYQEGPEISKPEEVPAGCKLLAFAVQPEDMFDFGGRVKIKVDPATLQIVSKRLPQQPLNIMTESSDPLAAHRG